MKDMYATPPRRRGPRSLLFFIIPLLALAAWTGLRRGPAPQVEIDTSLPAVGASTDVTVRLSEPARGVPSFKVRAMQGENTLAEQSREQPKPRPTWAPWKKVAGEETVDLRLGSDHQENLRNGTITLRIETIRAGTWLLPPSPVEQTFELEARLEPPKLQVISENPVVRQGGAGAVVYRAGESAVRHGVRVGELDIAGYPLPGSDEHFALYGVPYDQDDASEIRLFAVDELGNRAERRFLTRFDERPPRTDTIRLSDGFFEAVVPEILQETPDITSSGSLLEDYLQLNGELRRRNAAELRQLREKSRAERLWSGAFEQLPSSRVMAGFAERRTYVYDGEKVDEQTHLGHDLASTRRADIPASNAGVVVLARYLGIYGLTVVVDHGYGLMTLYSHLSSLGVDIGDEVAKGQTLGRTGTTGLAGGDHLHFTVLVGGVMVDPLEWWDRRWLESRLEAPLGDAFRVGA